VIRATARADGPSTDRRSGPFGVVVIDIEAEVPAAGVRLRCSTGRAGLSLHDRGAQAPPPAVQRPFAEH